MVSIQEAQFSNAYSELGDQFFSPQLPTPVPKPTLIKINTELADFFGLSPDLLAASGTEIFAGNSLPHNSRPIATVYAGHQFGHWNPQLGDGRAVLLGELTADNGRLYDIQLKGGGPTPYSRMGDGRSPLGPVLREYLISEAMAALGVATTRALAAVTTGERVVRDTLLPGAILTRVASSHIRIGTFQYFAARQDYQSVKALADHVIDRHYAAYIDQAFPEDRYTGLLTAVIKAQARLVAQWMSIGFIHGVMNTDNMLLCGETVDYGPCAFMDAFNPDQVFSSIDQQGRYAYNKQADIAVWNLSWLANALLPLLSDSQTQAIKKAEQALSIFAEDYEHHYQTQFAHKLGFDVANDQTGQLTQSFLALLAKHRLDFTLSFRNLVASVSSTQTVGEAPSQSEYDHWVQSWRSALTEQGISDQQAALTLCQHNPLYIPRNHWVEKAIHAATDHSDYTLFNSLHETLTNPFDHQPEKMELAHPPAQGEAVFRTFCGT